MSSLLQLICRHKTENQLGDNIWKSVGLLLLRLLCFVCSFGEYNTSGVIRDLTHFCYYSETYKLSILIFSAFFKMFRVTILLLIFLHFMCYFNHSLHLRSGKDNGTQNRMKSKYFLHAMIIQQFTNMWTFLFHNILLPLLYDWDFLWRPLIHPFHSPSHFSLSLVLTWESGGSDHHCYLPTSPDGDIYC